MAEYWFVLVSPLLLVFLLQFSTRLGEWNYFNLLKQPSSVYFHAVYICEHELIEQMEC